MITLLGMVQNSRFFTIHSQGNGLKRYIIPDKYEIYHHVAGRIDHAEIRDYAGSEPSYWWRLKNDGSAFAFNPGDFPTSDKYRIVERVEVDMTKEVPQ